IAPTAQACLDALEQGGRPVPRSLLFLTVLAALVAALIVGALAPQARAQALSPGCASVNDPLKDGVYNSFGVFNGEFAAGDHITITVGPPINPANVVPTDPTLTVGGTVVDSESFPGTLQYTFPAAATVNVIWQVTRGNPTWDASCTPAFDPVQAITDL